MYTKDKLLIILFATFISTIVLAEIIGVKLFSLEQTLGLPLADLAFFGEKNLNFTLSVGVLPWPVLFILTDIINEYYGFKTVKFLSILSSVIICFLFCLIYLSIVLAPSEFWVQSYQNQGVPDMQLAFKAIMGQGMNIIIGSIVAFLVGQLVDAFVFAKLRKRLGEKHIWFRATASTLTSQFIDSFVVTYIAFWVARGYPFWQVSSWAMTAYIYKFVIAILFIPAIYLVRYGVERYLGAHLAQKMKERAQEL